MSNRYISDAVGERDLEPVTGVDRVAGCMSSIEIHPWTAEQLGEFLQGAQEKRGDIVPAWHVLAYTGA